MSKKSFLTTWIHTAMLILQIIINLFYIYATFFMNKNFTIEYFLIMIFIYVSKIFYAIDYYLRK